MGWQTPHVMGWACRGSMSNRRTFPSISQPLPQGTIHLHSIFTPLHMFPFQPRIIFYHQITVAIRWSRCDSEQSAHPPLSLLPGILLPLPPAASRLREGRELGQMPGGEETPQPATSSSWDQTTPGSKCLDAGRQQLPNSSDTHQAVQGNLWGALSKCGPPEAMPELSICSPLLHHSTLSPFYIKCTGLAPEMSQPSESSKVAGTRGALARRWPGKTCLCHCKPEQHRQAPP